MKWDKKRVIEKLYNLEVNLKRRPVKRDNSYLYILSRKYFGSWNKMMEEAGYKCKYFQNPKIPKKLLPEFYYFLGLVTTDGHNQYNKNKKWYNVSLYTSEKEEVGLILNLIENIFDYNSSIRKRKSFLSKRPNYQINISSKNVCEFLHKTGIPYGAKSYNIRLPSLIKFCSKKDFWHYLRGVFDGDGSIIFSGPNNTFKISSGSIKFIEDIQKKLVKEGFVRSRISRQKENVWEVKITNRPDIEKLYNLFYQNAEFFYPRKKLKWQSNMFKNTSPHQ